MNIGLSQRVLYHRGRAYDSIEHGWYSYLKEHTLTFIGNRLDQNFKELANQLDAFIISGGDDSTLRRTVEIKLTIEFLKQNKPIIGICHGCFLLAELLGSVIDQKPNHYDIDHSVIYNNELRQVNSFHNLYIKQVHKTATILVVDLEDDCEAWIDKNIAGIAWHPERMENSWIPTEISHLLEKK